ncbi:hypothetical protein [Gordonia sp. (in: high G+C Gram-positive bacteria)]|uniref:hypothetical protein n=1 Tax=Gordonia sp. (in: high G+C Gram-positive bacteria) TaxID=84139 RepID=UPI0033422FC1
MPIITPEPGREAEVASRLLELLGPDGIVTDTTGPRLAYDVDAKTADALRGKPKATRKTAAKTAAPDAD